MQQWRRQQTIKSDTRCGQYKYKQSTSLILIYYLKILPQAGDAKSRAILSQDGKSESRRHGVLIRTKKTANIQLLKVESNILVELVLFVPCKARRGSNSNESPQRLKALTRDHFSLCRGRARTSKTNSQCSYQLVVSQVLTELSLTVSLFDTKILKSLIESFVIDQPGTPASVLSLMLVK